MPAQDIRRDKNVSVASTTAQWRVWRLAAMRRNQTVSEWFRQLWRQTTLNGLTGRSGDGGPKQSNS